MKKKDLAHWALLAFQKALTSKNILSGFRAIEIWLLNPMTTKTILNEVFIDANQDKQ